MRQWIPRLRPLLYALLSLFVLLTSLGLFLLTTTPGLYLSLKMANLFLPGKMHLDNLQGRLLDTFSFSKLVYDTKELHLELADFKVDWQPGKLIRRQLQINNLQANKLTLLTDKQGSKKQSKTKSFKLPTLPFSIFINKLSLEQLALNNEFISQLRLQGQTTKKHWKISRLSFNAKALQFQVQGQGKTKAPYSFSSTIDLKPNTDQAPQLKGQIILGGDSNLYHWRGQLGESDEVRINGTLSKGSDLYNQVSWQDFSWPLQNNRRLESSSGKLRVNGKIPELLIDLSSTIEAPIPGKIKLQAKTNAQGFNLAGLLSLGETDIDLSMDYQNQQFNSLIKLGRNKIELSGSLPYQWQFKAKIVDPERLHPSLAALKTIITVSGSIKTANQGDLQLNLSPGHYLLPEDGLLKALEFKGGQLSAHLNPQALSLKGSLKIDQDKAMQLNLKLPGFDLSKTLFANPVIQGDLSLNINSLAFLEPLSAHLTKVEGQLIAKLKAKGRLVQPIIEGSIKLSKGRFYLPRLGLELNPVQMTLLTKSNQWEAKGSIHSAGKNLNIKGNGLFSPGIEGLMAVEGNNFPFLKTAEYIINISPQVQFAFAPQSLSLTGKVLIPYAQIKPQTFNKTVSLSDDVVFIQDKPSLPTNPLHLNTELRLEMGNEVGLDVKGLKGRLTGAINLHQLPQGPLNATGELTVVDGKYKAYGQDLTIEQGQLLFSGGLFDNPGIRIRASRQFNNASNSFAGSNQLFDFNSANIQTLNFGNNTTVGIEVGGNLKSPKIILFSNPPTLSQADILSMLVLGKPANQANQAGGQLLLAAISSMNLDSGSKGLQLLDQLKQTLGFDINLQSNAKYNQQTNQISESQAVLVGKSLSKRLYISYSLGLAKPDVNILTITYLLNKFFSIQVNASVAASGIDLLYNSQK